MIQNIIAAQRAFFATGATLDINYRIAALKKLRKALTDNEAAIAAALAADLGKSAVESYMCETGMAVSELSYMLRHIRRYAREKMVLEKAARHLTPVTLELGGQEPLHRGRKRKPASGSAAYRLRQVPQLRADLCGT